MFNELAVTVVSIQIVKLILHKIILNSNTNVHFETTIVTEKSNNDDDKWASRQINSVCS